MTSGLLWSDGFTAVQAAQKVQRIAFDIPRVFTAVQAAQKWFAKPTTTFSRFTAVQAAQKIQN